MIDFTEKTVLLTGGTGSFGQKCAQILLQKHHPKKLIIYSRDELKQFEMQQKFNDPRLRYFIGDIRDKDRLYRALYGVDIVIHAAALKQVPAIEYNPFEAVRTNIIGGYNVITACIDSGVEKCIALSTDKAANPINFYGATKLCSDKLFVSGNTLASGGKTKFAVVRYGNVVGSRGSILPLFNEQKKSGKITITDPQMTRFFITLDQGVNFVFQCFEMMAGGEIFVPKIPSVKIVDVATAIAPECKQEVIGIRPGEKLHELMITTDDARNTIEFEDFFVIQPEFHWWNQYYYLNVPNKNPKPCKEGFSYASHTNSQWMNVEKIKELIKENNL